MLAPLAGVAVLTSVVVIHELGHFSVARAQGIRVSEFSIGFGPKLWSRAATAPELPEYAVRLLPIGGFVSFPRATNRTRLEEMGLLKKGEKLDEFVEDTPDLLENRPAREQASVMVAGVVANVMLAWACLFTAGVSLGVPVVEPSPVVVSRVLPSSAAETAGFKVGDLLIVIDKQRVGANDVEEPLQSSLNAIKAGIERNEGFAINVLRDNRRVRLAVPRLPPLPVPEDASAPAPPPRTLGVELTQPAGKQLARVILSPAESAQSAVKMVGREARSILSSLQAAAGKLLTPGNDPNGAGLQGPIGIARMGSDLASTDTRRLLEFAAILSLNLAVFNALPLPGLDGWQLSLLAVESALRKPLPESAKESANALAGLLFLFAFSRVLLSDVADAAAGNAGLATFGIASGKALREYGPSVVIGIAAAQIVQLIRSSGDADREATASSRRGSGGRVATSRRKTPAKPPRRKQTVTGKSASQPSGSWWRRGSTSTKPPPKGRGGSSSSEKRGAWFGR